MITMKTLPDEYWCFSKELTKEISLYNITNRTFGSKQHGNKAQKALLLTYIAKKIYMFFKTLKNGALFLSSKTWFNSSLNS